MRTSIPTLSTRFQAVAGPRPEDWTDQATCGEMDPNLFDLDLYPEGHPEAFAACRRCPVSIRCNQWAEDNGEVAMVWGGQRRPNLPWMPKTTILRKIFDLIEQDWSNAEICRTLKVYRTVVVQIRASYYSAQIDEVT